VIASAHGGLPEIISNERTGLLVPPGDPDALGAGAARLIDDPNLRARLGSAASRDVGSRFSAKRMLTLIDHLYGELAPRQRVGGG
jgi:glycosyltransferase involved in cell wall biosynthesis